MTDPQPFFVAPGTRPPDARRLLLISYHFPPSEAAGALRWRKLAPFARARGWCLDVVTLDPSCLRDARAESLADLPEGTRLFGVPLPRLQREHLVTSALRLARQFRGGRRAPRPDSTDAKPSAQVQPAAAWRPSMFSRAYGAHLHNAVHHHWATAAAALASRLVARGGHHAVITCGPPHEAHVAGATVARRYGLPLVVDMRDPWRLVERLADSIDSPIWRWHARRHERAVVRHADLIVMNTDPARDAMRACYPSAASRIITVTNGCDDEVVPPSEHGRKFRITYSGAIYLDRDPRPLFEAARRLIESRSLTPQDLGITLVGTVQEFRGMPTTTLAREAGVERYVEVLPHRRRTELLDVLAASTLLVILPQDSHLAIPSKLFEYMQFDAWILDLAEPHSATARLLAGSDADVVSATNIAGITDRLEKRYEQYRQGERPTRLAADERFSRRRQATVLFDALERYATPG